MIAVVQGKSPATLKNVYQIDTPVSIPGSGTSNASVGTGSATGVAIANDAMKYKGAGYVYGGPADKPGDWDCSSFVSYVLGHDFNMALPNGGHYGAAGFPPHSHGPVTTDFFNMGTEVPRSQVQAGDLIIWHPHIGIAISNTTMISAQDEQLGTGTAGIDDASKYFGAQPRCQRVGG